MAKKKQNQRKKPNCSKGFSCGFSCQPRGRTCKSNVDESGNKIVENYSQFLSRTTPVVINNQELDDLSKRIEEFKQNNPNPEQATPEQVKDFQDSVKDLVKPLLPEEDVEKLENDDFVSPEQIRAQNQEILDKARKRRDDFRDLSDEVVAKADEAVKESDQLMESLGLPTSGEQDILDSSPEKINSFREGLKDLIKPLLPDDVVEELESSRASEFNVTPSDEDISILTSKARGIIEDLLPNDVVEALKRKDEELGS